MALRRLPRTIRQVLRYAVVGGSATLLQSGLYATLHSLLGVQGANVAAWLVCTLLATVGHRRFTFRLHRQDTRLDLLVGTLTSLAGLGATAGALALLGTNDGFAGAMVVLAMLTLVGCGRFLVLRRWFLGGEPTGKGRSHRVPPVERPPDTDAPAAGSANR